MHGLMNQPRTVVIVTAIVQANPGAMPVYLPKGSGKTRIITREPA